MGELSLAGSFSERSRCLGGHDGLRGSFADQSRDLARPQRSLFPTADGDIDCIDNGDVPLAENVVDRSHMNVSELANESRKRKITSSVDLSRDSGPSQKRRFQRFSQEVAGRNPAVEVIDLTIEVIDLTVNVEHCAICPNVLGHGQGDVSRMFVFTTCGCVLCGECLPGNFREEECKSTSVIKDVCCPKRKHFIKGKQEARQIFGLECAICYTTSADRFDQGGARRNGMIRTSCGHTFCRGCIRRWVKEQRMEKCPSCRFILRSEGKKWCRFKTIQRGIVCG